MRKLVILICAFSFSLPEASAAIAHQGTPPTPDLPLKVIEFIKLTTDDLEKLTGRKMNLRERMDFSLLKMRMKKAAKKNPDISVLEFNTRLKRKSAGGIVLAVILGAVLLSFVLFLMLYTDNR